LRSKHHKLGIPKMKFTPSKSLSRARLLRRNQTEAEKKLWGYLRNSSLNSCKFVRQAPVGPYIADFLCFDKKLIVEVDGATHGDPHEVAYDAKRTEYLELMGYRVFRCYNADVFENVTGVLDGILIQLEKPQLASLRPKSRSPHPAQVRHLPPSGAG
jgi:very-short-patch-repair endonuclease